MWKVGYTSRLSTLITVSSISAYDAPAVFFGGATAPDIYACGNHGPTARSEASFDHRIQKRYQVSG